MHANRPSLMDCTSNKWTGTLDSKDFDKMGLTTVPFFDWSLSFLLALHTLRLKKWQGLLSDIVLRLLGFLNILSQPPCWTKLECASWCYHHFCVCFFFFFLSPFQLLGISTLKNSVSLTCNVSGFFFLYFSGKRLSVMVLKYSSSVTFYFTTSLHQLISEM